MNLRSHDQYLAVATELEAFDIPIAVESLKKHIRLSYNLAGKDYCYEISRGKRTGFREIRNSRAAVRRHLKEAGLLKSHDKNTDDEQENTMGSLSKITKDNLEVVNNELRMRDLDIASALGYVGRLDNVRQLIKANQSELGRYGEVVQIEKPTGRDGGRPSTMYMLNRDQALLLAMFSRTFQAADVREQVIRAYAEWEEQHHSQVAHLPAPEPEVLMNGPAIQAITEAIVARINQEPGSSVTTDQISSMFMDLVKWEQTQFEAIYRKVQNPPTLSGVGPSEKYEELIDKKIGAMARTVMQTIDDVRNQVQASNRSIAEQIQSITTTMSSVMTTVAAINDRIASAPLGESIDETPVDIEPIVTAKAAPAKPEIEEDEENPYKDDELVGMESIYTMVGINPNMIRERHSLSMKMRYSLEKFGKRQRIQPVKRKKNGIQRAFWPSSMVKEWYARSGNRLIGNHLTKEHRRIA